MPAQQLRAGSRRAKTLTSSKHALAALLRANFEKAGTNLLERDGRLLNCMKRMQMTMPEGDLRGLIHGLAVAMPPAPRPPRQR